MKFLIVPQKWDDVLHIYRPIPLDDAEPAIIRLAMLVHGNNITPNQFEYMLMDLGISKDEIGHSE